MLSSTSLLHGNCVFNRNNTVATQQGMKTYWLCKSYRISMCRARCITHQGKIISATGVHNHPPHMRGNGSSTVSNGSGSSANTGVSNSNNTPSISHTGSSSSVGIPTPSNSSGALGLRFSQSSGPSGNMNQQNYHEHRHSTATSPPQALLPSTYVTNPHLHSTNTTSSTVAPPPHLFLQSMPNLLVQHYPSSQSSQVLQQSVFPPQHHNSLHNYEISSVMQSSHSNESRNVNSSFDPNEKSLDVLNKNHLNDDHIRIHNAAVLSPTELHTSSIKTGHIESLTNDNEMGEKISSSEHHQVQVIDSITISPGSGHNFKMESM